MYLTKWHHLILRQITSIQRINFENRGQTFRQFSASSGNNENFYNTLGINNNATQSDVKAAYYKLSMQYHPDKNKGSDIAAQKFRDISEAYEVLGNFRLRKLYDKGIIHNAGSRYADNRRKDEVKEEDDPQTKFYKARMRKSEVPSSGRTPIYDFDEWSRAHYGASFQKRNEAKIRNDRRMRMQKSHADTAKKEILVLGIIFCAIGILSILLTDTSLDVDKRPNKRGNQS